MGKDFPRLPRNSAGINTLLPDEQVQNGLQWGARFVREIFSDLKQKRDAAYFAAGYNQAHKDWASRNGSSSE